MASGDGVGLDIRDDEAVARVVAEVVARHGRLDFLVHNAGGRFVSDAAEIRAKGWRAVVDTNRNGARFRIWGLVARVP